MRSITILFVLLPALARASDDLTIGSVTPAMGGLTHVAGPPLTETRGRVRIVEFWSVMCSPCVDAIAHLNAVAERHAGDIDVLAVALPVYESPEKDLAELGRFLPAHPHYANVTVAFSDPPSREAWLDRSFTVGIPATFVTDRNGRIAWRGLPWSVDDPLASILAGTWEHEAARAAHERAVAERRHQHGYRTTRARLEAAKEFEGLLSLTREYIAAHPSADPTRPSIFDYYLTTDLVRAQRFDDALASIQRWGEGFDHHAMHEAVYESLDHPGFRELGRAHLPAFRTWIDRLTIEEAAMRNWGFVYTYRHARMEDALGDPARAVPLMALTLRYLPEQSRYLSPDELRNMRRVAESSTCTGDACPLPPCQNSLTQTPENR